MESGKPGGDICKATNVERVSQKQGRVTTVYCVLVSWARAALDQQYMIYLLQDGGYFFFFFGPIEGVLPCT